MAVLAASDWQIPPRDNTMDITSGNNHREQQAQQPTQHQQQPPQQQQSQGSQHAFQVQQQPQGQWTPSISAQPFYPTFYQNTSQSAQQYPHVAQQPQFFDPANAQLAQWAYQQMMFNAQQGFMPQQPQHHPLQRNGSTDYFAQNQINPMFNSPFPSGTPPPHRGGDAQQQQLQQNGQYTGFHPYRRPTRQQSHSLDPNERRAGPGSAPSPPYTRPDASGSSSSVNSTHSQRQRADSVQSGNSNGQGSIRSRNGSPAAAVTTTSSPRSSPPVTSSSPSAPRVPHHRSSSSSSSNTTSSSSRPAGLSPGHASSTTSTSPPTSATSPRPSRPSPLSQGTFTASEKRMSISKDDSDIPTSHDPMPNSGMLRSGGLKGRLRRALSFNPNQTLKEEDEDDASIKASKIGRSAGKKPALINTTVGKSGTSGASSLQSPPVAEDDSASNATVQTKKKGRAASLFNSRFNASTDNMSLSSTVSSASVMIRKMGSMARLARRNSLAGITSLFKDKEKDGDGKKKKKDKKSGKSEASEASVSHVTAELDRGGSDWTGPELTGLSPAAKLARQHTLKSNAEAAERAKKGAEPVAPPVSATANGNGVDGASVPTWERNTATGQGSVSPVKGGMRINEDGTRVFVEEDEEEDHSDEDSGPYPSQPGFHADGWDDDEDWDGEDDEDLTIRIGMERTSVDGEYEEPEPWATDVRRSVERTRVPTRGILKYASNYDQQEFETSTPTRARSNSYNARPSQPTELGPLARIPSPDPDHIDGLHRHPSHTSNHSSSGLSSTLAPSLPPLTFDSPLSAPNRRASLEISSPEGHGGNINNPNGPHPPERPTSIFSHPNSSAPVLSSLPATAPTLTHRSATTPSKRLAFAHNLSVYDTFPPSVYDRRSEPATWSRLTPALAQRIKEELNSYKMEEMEVHAASRIHTQFFV